MFIIKNTVTGRIHKEPSRARKGYGSLEYASERAAKAGVTRTLKYYQKAIQQVSDVVAEGKSEYYAPLYNAYRDATDGDLGRTHVNDPATYEVMTLEQYGDPQRTDTGTCPYNGKTITRTISVNDAWTHMDPLCESHWTN
jgi:hypothetical protein